MNQENNENEVKENIQDYDHNEDKIVEEKDAEPTKKTNWLAIILGLLAAALFTYIVWGEINKKNGDASDEKDKNTIVDNQSQKLQYFEVNTITKKLNGKDVKLGFSYFLNKLDQNSVFFADGAEYEVHSEFYIDGKFIKEIGYFVVNNSKNMTEGEVIIKLHDDKKFGEFLKATQNIGVIKTDKEYIYLQAYFDTAQGLDSDLLVYNSDGGAILNKEIRKSGTGAVLDKTCLNYTKYVNQAKIDKQIYSINDYHNSMYYVENNMIYYIEDSYGKSTTLPEYRIRINKSSAIYDKIADCKYEREGAVLNSTNLTPSDVPDDKNDSENDDVNTISTDTKNCQKKNNICNFQYEDIECWCGNQTGLLSATLNGKTISNNHKITIRVGEKIKVRMYLPKGCGNIEKLTRTSASGPGAWSNFLTQYSEPNANSGTDITANYYDWIIVGKKSTSRQIVTISQTAVQTTNRCTEIKSSFDLQVIVK